MEMDSERETKAIVSTNAKILAGASVIIAVAGYLLSSVSVLGFGKIYVLYICWLIWFAACLCGIMSLRALKNIKGFRWSRLLSWIGCIFAIYCILVATHMVNEWLFEKQLRCRNNLKVLSNSIQTYCEKHNGEFPDSSKWCDLIISEPNNEFDNKSNDNPNILDKFSKKSFSCLTVNGVESGYAFNKNLAGKHISEVDPDVIVLFETTTVGLNQNGGPELMCPDRHKFIFGESGSYVVCLEKPIVRFVPRSEAKNLRWNP